MDHLLRRLSVAVMSRMVLIFTSLKMRAIWCLKFIDQSQLVTACLVSAISVWLALVDAVARSGCGLKRPNLNAPATPEAIFNAVIDVRA
jgi:xanthine dehydrogenase molybdopterin-binding subunit B